MKYNFPKIELHCHLDGSFRIETMYELAKQRGITLPGESLENYAEWMKQHSDAQNVNEYLKMFDVGTEVLQDKESLKRLAFELIEDLANKGVRYAEIRFAPQLHTRKDLDQAKAIDAVLEGKKEAETKYPSIKTGIILCMMCVGEETVNWKENDITVDMVKEYLGKGVVCLDLAGAEGIVPLANFGPLFKKAVELKLPIICHAGDSQGPDTVKDALSFGVSRIGHGHHIYLDKELCKEAADKQVALEICPTSNIQCKSQPSYKEHPAKKLLDMGVPVTINTDNMIMTRVDLDDEYDHCINEMGFDFNDLIKMNLNSINASFAPEDYKEKIKAELSNYAK